MPGGFLKKFGTASWGITGTLVAVALVWAATGVKGTDDPTTTTAATTDQMRQRFIKCLPCLWDFERASSARAIYLRQARPARGGEGAWVVKGCNSAAAAGGSFRDAYSDRSRRTNERASSACRISNVPKAMA